MAISEFTTEPITCNRCGKTRPAEGFGRIRSKRSGVWNKKRVCKECEHEYVRANFKPYAPQLAADRTCRECGETKPAGEFRLSPTMPDGVDSWCRECSKVYQRRWYESNSAARKLSVKRQRCTAKFRARTLAKAAQVRASKLCLPFDLDREWVQERIEVGVCEVTGIKFDLNALSGRGWHRCPWAPSLDRTIPSLGYTKSNVRVVVLIYNFCKSTFTHDDVVSFANQLIQKEARQKKQERIGVRQ